LENQRMKRTAEPPLILRVLLLTDKKPAPISTPSMPPQQSSSRCACVIGTP
jgi:hypothetical protein